MLETKSRMLHAYASASVRARRNTTSCRPRTPAPSLDQARVGIQLPLFGSTRPDAPLVRARVASAASWGPGRDTGPARTCTSSRAARTTSQRAAQEGPTATRASAGTGGPSQMGSQMDSQITQQPTGRQSKSLSLSHRGRSLSGHGGPALKHARPGRARPSRGQSCIVIACLSLPNSFTSWGACGQEFAAGTGRPCLQYRMPRWLRLRHRMADERCPPA